MFKLFSSLHLFRVAMCGLFIKKNFSVVHRLQGFVMFVYGFALARAFHIIVNSFPSSFNCHRCLQRSVSFLLFSCLNDIWWFLYLVLNSLAVKLMYVSFVSRIVLTKKEINIIHSVGPLALFSLQLLLSFHPVYQLEAYITQSIMALTPEVWVQ